MRKHLALILAMLMLAGCLAGCSNKPVEAAPTNETVDSATPNEPEEPSRIDLNLSTNKSYASVDPAGTRTVVDVLMHRQVYEPLYQMNEYDGGFVPVLATAYDLSEDGLTWTFDIREGVKFHNGETLKASDVVFTMNRAREAAITASFLAAVSDVKADGDYKVVFTLANPVAAFINQLTNIEILSEKEVTEQGEAFGTKVAAAGTGPYMLSKYDGGNEWQFAAFPDYWQGEASIKTVNYTVVTDNAAGLIAFENGELDFFTPNASDLPLLEGNDAYHIELSEANHISYVFINWKANDYLADPAVRQAIAHAINKEDMNIAAFDGRAVVTDFMENSHFVNAAPTETKSYAYDPELSKKLLADAGYTTPINIGKINTNANSYFAKMATVLQAELEAVGIIAEVYEAESQTNSALFRTQDYDIGVSGGSGQGDYAAFRQRIHSASPSHYVDISDAPFVDWKRMDELWDLGDIESDNAKRLEYYTELNNLIMDSACWLPIFHKTVPYVWDADLNAKVGHTDYFIYDWNWK